MPSPCSSVPPWFSGGTNGMTSSGDLIRFGLGGLAYAYAGYPLLLAACARLWPLAEPRVGEGFPSVSVVVACAGDVALVPARVADLLAQGYPDLEVIVVLDGVAADADLRERVGELGARVRMLALPEAGGKTVAQNFGAAEARGEVLVFTDVGCRFAPGAIAELVAPLADPDVAASCGELAYTGTGPEGWYWRCECVLKRLESRFSGVLGANGPIYAVRRADYVQLPPAALSDLVEPMAIVFLRGGRVVYRPGARAEEPAPVARGWPVRAKRRITSRALTALPLLMPALDVFARPRLAFAFASHKVLRWVSWVFVLALVAGLAVWPAGQALLGAGLVLAGVGWLVPGWRVPSLGAYAVSLVIAQVAATVDWVRGVRVARWTPTHAPASRRA